MNIGIFGGTFDPPHVGHLVIADQALTQLQLDEVWFMPAGQPPHKLNNDVSAAQHRVAMTRLAIAGHTGFTLSTFDVDRAGPHYSAVAMEMLEQQHPQHDWCFIMGADSLEDLPRWYAPQRLIARATLAVASRPGVRPDLNALEQVIPGLSVRVQWVDAPLVDLSSTQLRQMVKAGASLRYLVPDAVIDYIEQHGLYRE